MKLKFKTAEGNDLTSIAPPAPGTSDPPTQPTEPKVKISFKKKTSTEQTEPTAAPTASEPPKPKRQYNKKPKPEKDEDTPNSAKKAPAKKRKIKAEDDGETATPPAKKPKPGIRLSFTAPKADDSVPKAPTTKVGKIRIPNTVSFKPPVRSTSIPHLKVHARGKPPPRPVGVGYDSEGEEIEEDPAIENQIILSFMVQDEKKDAEYIRQMINERKIGVRVQEGGADIMIRFFSGSDSRRAVVTVRGRRYAAILVDLPCVIESMKGWDKRNWWKVADICQKLLVTGSVATDEEARTYPIPPEIDSKHWLYPHGLTPPMKWVRKRRFRHNVNFRRIEEVESAVEALLDKNEDRREAGWTITHEFLEPGQELDQDDAENDDEADFIEASELELDQTQTGEMVEDDDDLTRLMEEGFADIEGEMEIEASPATMTPSAAMEHRHSPEALLQTAITSDSGVTPASQDETGDEAMESGDDDEGEVNEEDEEEKARQDELAEQREEIQDLRKEIAAFEEQAKKQTNPMLKKRAVDKAKSLKAELELKLAGLGDDEEE